MKPIPAIVEPAAADVDLVAEQVVVALADLLRIQRSVTRLRGQLDDAVSTEKMRRIEIGRLLERIRPTWPKSGPNAKGWGEFLARVKIDDSTAHRYMREFRDPEAFARDNGASIDADTGSSEPVRGKSDSPAVGDRDTKPASAPQLALVPSPSAGPIETSVLEEHLVGQLAELGPAALKRILRALKSEPEVDIDRDTWCTPRALTEAIGGFDLDPCSNERSTVSAVIRFALDLGIDGLAHAEDVAAAWRVFVNPPYSDVPPWVAAYKHTRFCFLLKLDTSTKWFAELLAATELILIPRKRVQFEPPPGVPPERAIAQQFPHALFYARAEDATPEIRALCWAWRVEHSDTTPPLNA